MSLNCGIIGLTNTGKTTIFNCISNKKAEASSYAFSASKSNVGMVEVPDNRLYKLDEYINTAKIVPATVEIVDIPGLTKGSSKGEGVGNKFLADLQQTDAIIHVLRCFDDAELAHIEGSVDPVRDKGIVDLELQVRDLDLVERKIQRTEKIAQHGDKEARRALDVCLKLKEQLENMQNIRDMNLDENEREVLNDLYLLTDKPVIYVCNVDEDSSISGNKFVDAVKEAIKGENTEMIIIAGQLESEIAELEDPDDRLAFLEDAGLTEPGVNRLIRSAYAILNLQSFFTIGPKEIRA